jgi:hypothetical protein
VTAAREALSQGDQSALAQPVAPEPGFARIRGRNDDKPWPRGLRLFVARFGWRLPSDRSLLHLWHELTLSEELLWSVRTVPVN